MKYLTMVFCALAALAIARIANAQAELLFDPTNPEGPVVVTAERAIFERGTGITRFTGGVIVTHANLRLTCDEAEVETVAVDSSQIAVVRVFGNVRLINEEADATSQQGIYLVDEGIIRMSGGVRLVTPTFTLSGPEFVYDIETGQGTLEEGGAADIQTSDQ